MQIKHDVECECGLCKIFKMNLEVLEANTDAHNGRAAMKESK